MDTQETETKPGNTTRRTFLETGSMAVLGLTAPGRARATRVGKSLALSGGPQNGYFSGRQDRGHREVASLRRGRKKRGDESHGEQ